MQRRPRYTRFFQLLLLGIYFVFFAVQLHLRYAFLSPVPISEQTVVAIQAAGLSKQVKTDQQVHAVRQESKLNKRYHPQTVIEACLVKEEEPAVYTVIQPLLPRTTAALCSTPQLHSPQRGPPFNS